MSGDDAARRLHLTEDEDEEDAVVAFTRSLTNGFVSAGDAGTDQ